MDLFQGVRSTWGVIIPYMTYNPVGKGNKIEQEITFEAIKGGKLDLSFLKNLKCIWSCWCEIFHDTTPNFQPNEIEKLMQNFRIIF